MEDLSAAASRLSALGRELLEQAHRKHFHGQLYSRAVA